MRARINWLLLDVYLTGKYGIAFLKDPSIQSKCSSIHCERKHSVPSCKMRRNVACKESVASYNLHWAIFNFHKLTSRFLKRKGLFLRDDLLFQCTNETSRFRGILCAFEQVIFFHDDHFSLQGSKEKGTVKWIRKKIRITWGFFFIFF